jgi:alkylation response protein AidB-like acyl-CoA dehydrogenase
MNFTLTEDQSLMVSAARRMVETRIEPILKRHPADKPLPKSAMLDIFAEFAELGITAPRLPADAGGGGLNMLDYGLILEQLPPVLALSLASHEGTILRIHLGCPDHIRQRYLPDLIAGRKIACTANTEANAGSDSGAIRTKLEIEGEHAYLTGRKMWITNASIADVINVSCVTGVDDNGKPVTRRALLDRSEVDIEIRETAITGLRQGHLSELVFERTRVPSTHIMGDAGDAAKTLTMAWNGNRPLLGLMCVHLAQRAFDLARDYAASRQQFGKPLANHQLVQQDLADIETAIISSRLMCYYALNCIDRGLRANGSSAMAKRYATQACERAIHLAMQIHGAMGISEELGLEQMWRDARVFQVPDGMNGILALIQGREITNTAAFR